MWNDTRANPLLPERAPSEGPRSTAARGSARVPFPRDELYTSSCTAHRPSEEPLFRLRVGTPTALVGSSHMEATA